MTYRAKRNNAVFTMLEEPYLIKDWEVVELVLEHKGKSVIRYEGVLLQVNRREFHKHYELIPERIKYD